MQSDIYYFCNHEHNYYVVIFITTSLNSSAMLNVFEILSNKECNFREFSIMSEPMDLEEEMLRPPSPGTKEYEAAFPPCMRDLIARLVRLILISHFSMKMTRTA